MTLHKLSPREKRPTDTFPSIKTVNRLEKRCRRHGRHGPSFFSEGGPFTPIYARFWNAHGHRLLAIMPTGEIYQRVDADDDGLTDPNALACYHRWYWEEMHGAAQARRRGFTAMAFRRLDTARRIRRMHERELRGAVPMPLEAAE